MAERKRRLRKPAVEGAERDALVDRARVVMAAIGSHLAEIHDLHAMMTPVERTVLEADMAAHGIAQNIRLRNRRGQKD